MYIATLAPGVTFWDAGEFVAAVQVLGIPHPPGTPLFVLLARAWSDMLGFLPRAVATNLLSAACTAVSGGALALFLTRSTGARVAALAAALCAGGMSTVWLNATETEVYAASLLLASVMLLAAQRAGDTGDSRWVVLVAYAFGLAVPLHLSALVAAPAAIVLAAHPACATTSRVGAIRWRWAVLLTGAFCATVGAGLARWPVAVVGALLMLLAAARSSARPSEVARAHPVLTILLAGAAVIVGLSALAYLPIRAAHHPFIDEGHPVTWQALWDVVGRRQYGAQPLWPRQAPLWAQFANVFEYADWQIALGLSPGVAPSWMRTPLTVLFAGLAVVGSLAHRARDRRGWRALLVLLGCASVGLVLYMNFRAGTSFGYGVLPPTLVHESRDRDYFFTLAFWVWGAWAGFGAVVLAARARRPWLVLLGVCAAGLPIALNWRAVDRTRMPQAVLPRLSAEALLWSAPPDAVLVTGGDNDSFPMWYLQAVERARPDVTVVIAPLLPARWYRAQVARRHALLDSIEVATPVRTEREALARISAHVRQLGRPLAVTLPAGPARRDALGGHWVLHGAVFVNAEAGSGVSSTALHVPIDTTVASAFVAKFHWGEADTLSDAAIDPAPGLFASVLACPAFARSRVGVGVRADSLASPCKFR